MKRFIALLAVAALVGASFITNIDKNRPRNWRDFTVLMSPPVDMYHEFREQTIFKPRGVVLR